MSIYAIHHQEPKFIFIINYKVMYSSLYRILSEYFPAVVFSNKLQFIGINILGYTKFAIVRNPYSRAVSAFYGKCRLSPQKNLHKEKTHLLYCQQQQQQLHTLKSIRKESFEIAQPAIRYTLSEYPKERMLLNENFKLLSSISFEEYVNCLTLILPQKNADGHFQKQFNAFSTLRKILFIFCTMQLIISLSLNWKILNKADN